MKPIDVNFESGFSIPDSVNRLAMISGTFNSTTLGPRWIFGSVTSKKVALECRSEGVKRSYCQFNGKFHIEGNAVSLKGRFGMAEGTKISLVLWLSMLVPGFFVLARELILDYNQGLLMLFAFVCVLLASVLVVIKMRVAEYPDEVKFISVNIQNMLRKV